MFAEWWNLVEFQFASRRSQTKHPCWIKKIILFPFEGFFRTCRIVINIPRDVARLLLKYSLFLNGSCWTRSLRCSTKFFIKKVAGSSFKFFSPWNNFIKSWTSSQMKILFHCSVKLFLWKLQLACFTIGKSWPLFRTFPDSRALEGQCLSFVHYYFVILNEFLSSCSPADTWVDF